MKAAVPVALIAVLVISSARALGQTAPAPSGTPTFPPAGIQFEKPFLDYLIPAIKQTGKPARIYYAACPFPRLNFDLPEQGLTGMNSIRQMLLHEAQLGITQDRGGLIRITIGKVWTDILRTKIRRLGLNGYQQYGSASAILAILESPEMRDAGKRFDLDTRLQVIDIIVGGPISGAPHLPPVLKNVTVDQAFDAIAQTFGAVVLYQYCEPPGGNKSFRVYAVSE